MDSFPRYFSLEQANQLLEIISPLVAEMLATRGTILELQPKLEPVLQKAVHNGGSLISAEALNAFGKLKNILYQIHQYDVFVKDVNSGLIDFPSIRDGKVIFLCWQFGEKQVGFWHELEDGFQGRRPI